MKIFNNSRYCCDFKNVLGRGSFGVVFLGKDLKDKNGKIAVKRIPSSIGQNYVATREFEVLQRIKNGPNVLQLLDFDLEENFVYILMELCDLGDLEHFIVINQPKSGTKLNIMVQCASGLSFLHNFHTPIVHRDLKPSNILIKSDIMQNDFIVKIADFGFAETFSEEQQVMKTAVGGTPSYMAPEILKIPAKYTKAVDVFSLGLVYQVIILFDCKKHKELPRPGIQDTGHLIIYALYLIVLKSTNESPKPLFESNSEHGDFFVSLKKLVTHMVTLESESRPSMRDVEMELKALQMMHGSSLVYQRVQRSQEKYLPAKVMKDKSTSSGISSGISKKVQKIICMLKKGTRKEENATEMQIYQDSMDSYFRSLNGEEQRDLISKLNESLKSCDWNQEYIQSSIEFVHKEDFSMCYDSVMLTLPQVGRAVCALSWPNGAGTGFVLRCVRDASKPIPSTHCILLTCAHLLKEGLESAVYGIVNTSQAKFRFYAPSCENAIEIAVSVLQVIERNDYLDYALLCLESNDDLTIKLGGHVSASILGRYISDINRKPPKSTVLTLVAHLGKKVLDPYVRVHELQDILSKGFIQPVTRVGHDDLCLFYKCSTSLGASGAPVFDLNNPAIHCMHLGGVGFSNSTTDYEYGISLYHVVCDIRDKVLDDHKFLTKQGFYNLFPAFKGDDDKVMQLE